MEMADSIQRLGLLSTQSFFDQNNCLVAGETRLNACRSLGWDRILFQEYADTLDEHSLLSIEIEENVKRRDVDWKDRARSMERLHALYKEDNEGWTMDDTAKKPSAILAAQSPKCSQSQ